MAEWRDGKTISECNRYMLDNQLACDVNFEVGPEGGATETIPAHKYPLATRSPVFCAMFNGKLKEMEATIPVVDIDPDTFRDILQYIYTDIIQLSPGKILDQMYAAEKYILTGLASGCVDWMERNISNENACAILECALLHRKEDLATRSRQYILQNVVNVVNDPSFVKLPHGLLNELLSSDELYAQEVVIYEACLKWAKYKCSERGEDATGSAIRQALGDCLQLVRFPLMKPSMFVDLMEKCPNVLTKDEENSLMKYYISEKQTSFSNNRRVSLETYCVQRFKSVYQRTTWKCNDGKADAISFKCDRSIHMNGITVYGNENSSPHKLEVEVCGQDDKAIYEETKDMFPSSGKQNPTHLCFSKEIIISPNLNYTIIQRMWGSDVYYGNEGLKNVSSRGVTFKFSESPLSTNNTKVNYGQIPGLLFKLVNSN